jgi:serine protease Do
MTPIKRSFVARLLLFIICALSFQALAQQPSNKDNSPDIAGVIADKAAPKALPPPSASARDLFSRYKSQLVQVRVLRKSANEQSSLGSGFVVRDDGPKGVWLLTNYHVVSSLAINPEKFRIELRPTSERTVKATLVAVDVIHDLAVLRTEPEADAPPWPAFALRDGLPMQGERIFSLGNPLEVGFLISEGIYNGLVESRIYEQMIFSGALNSGMSGGPTIDDAGRVVGVNVATHSRGMLISFLVPIRYARELLEKSWQAPPRKEWRTEIARQLLIHQDFVAGKLLSKEKIDEKAGAPAVPAITPPISTPVKTPAAAIATTTGAATTAATTAAKNTTNAVTKANAGFGSQNLAGRTVPTLDGTLTKCWAGGRDGERLRYQRESLNCGLRAELFVRNSLYVGSLGISHVLLRNDKLATPQFLALESSGHMAQTYLSMGGNETTPAACQDEYVRGSLHVYRVAICLRAYRKFEGIYNFNVSAIQVDDARERLSSDLTLNGVSFGNGQRLSRMFLERLQ